MKDQIITRSFKISAPDFIVSIYETLQFELNNILSNKSIVNNLIKVDVKGFKGYLRKEIKPLLNDNLKNKVPNAGWYRNILIDNLIYLLKSRKEQLEIYEILKNNSFEINSKLMNELHANNLYPTKTYLSNLSRTKSMPILPKNATFRLDYSTSSKQMFKMDDDLNCSIQVVSHSKAKKLNIDEWKEFKIYLPTYIRNYKNIVKVSKPLFIRDSKTNRLIGQVAYQFKQIKNELNDNILGVDLGRIKLYSATVLKKDGTYSNEFISSKELQRLHNKLNLIKSHINYVYDKYQRSKQYLVETSRQRLRKLDYKRNRNKLTKLRNNISWLVANELICLAIQNKCVEIHVENLTWVNSTGGKWIFSQIQERLIQLAEINGIKIVRVSPAYTSKTHPITGELGKVNQRKVIFSNGEEFDRDYLASINIAKRQSKYEIKKMVNKKSIRTKRKSNRRSNYLEKLNWIKENILTKNENNYVAIFSYHKDNSLSMVYLNQNVINLSNSLIAGKFSNCPLLT